MATRDQIPAPNAFVARARKIYNPIGFSKGYNFVLWFIFSGALLGFTLARLQYLNFYGVFCSAGPGGSNHAAPGECFYYLRGHEKIGMIMHLATILPAGLLVLFQFVPVIRHKFILFHRINGYLIILLALLSTAGVFMIARNAFGGSVTNQTWSGFVSIAFIGALVMAYINIKRVRIDQHRAWMLRAWFYASCIITLRLIFIIGALTISQIGGYYDARPCYQISNIFGGSQDSVLALYPDCGPYFSGENPNQQAVVEANFSGNTAQLTVALGLNFGSAGWLAFALHAIGVEVYLNLTPAESNRLRKVSRERRLEAGKKNLGTEDLTEGRLEGDQESSFPADDQKVDEAEYGSDSKIGPQGGS